MSTSAPKRDGNMCILGFEWTYVLTALIFIGVQAYGNAVKNEWLENFGSVITGVVILTVFWTH